MKVLTRKVLTKKVLTRIAQKFRSQRGFSLIELLIAALLTGIVTSAAFQFYAKMHIESETQFDKSEIQHICRVTLAEIKKNLRMAGYKLSDTLPSYTITGSTLQIYYSDTQPIDTVTYWLQEFTASEYAKGAGRPSGVSLYNLMKKVNADAAQPFADYVVSLSFTPVDSANITVSVEAQAQRFDEAYTLNEGFHTYTMSELINIRNMSL